MLGTASGPIDRLGFVAVRYSAAQLSGYHDSLYEALKLAGELKFRVSTESDLNKVLVTRGDPTPGGTLALASAAPPDAFEVHLDPDFETASQRDPYQPRDQFPPYRAGLQADSPPPTSAMFCSLGFTMRGPTGVLSESRNTYRERRDGTDFANVRLEPAPTRRLRSSLLSRPEHQLCAPSLA